MFNSPCRKQRLYRDFSASEREEIIKRKTQMEEQIKALEKRMYLEDQARDARRNRPKLRAKMAWYGPICRVRVAALSA